MRTIEIRGGFSIDHLVAEHFAPQWSVMGGPGWYATLGALAAAQLQPEKDTQVSLTATLPQSAADELSEAGVCLADAEIGDVPRVWILNSHRGRRVIGLAAAEGSHELAEDEAVIQEGNPEEQSDKDVLLRCAPWVPLTSSEDQIVCVDPDQVAIATLGWEYFERLAANTSVFLPSRVQLAQLDPDPLRAAHQLRSRTERSVVARLDSDGALVLPKEGGTWWVKAPEVSVVDSTGAGDSHAGAFAAALENPDSPESLVEAAKVAAAVVASTLRGVGAAELKQAKVSRQDVDQILVEEETT